MSNDTAIAHLDPLRGDSSRFIQSQANTLVPRKKYLSTSIIASRLGVSRRTVRLWAEAGQLQAVKFGRQWRFDEVTFLQWVQNQEKASAGSVLDLAVRDRDA
jgi:excisionase family DNA binding protein